VVAPSKQAVGGSSPCHREGPQAAGPWPRPDGRGAQKYPEVVLLYHGVEDPDHYEIPYRWPEADEWENPRRMVYALGAHRIDSMKWHDRFYAQRGGGTFHYDL